MGFWTSVPTSAGNVYNTNDGDNRIDAQAFLRMRLLKSDERAKAELHQPTERASIWFFKGLLETRRVKVNAADKNPNLFSYVLKRAQLKKKKRPFWRRLYVTRRPHYGASGRTLRALVEKHTLKSSMVKISIV